MKIKKKRTIIIGSIVAAMFIVPLAVFAVVYNSNDRTNRFSPGSVDIAVHEGNGNDEGKEVEKEYHWTQDGTSYSTEKLVQIKDTRKYPGEVLRVCFVPMWYDRETPANVCDVFNFGTPVQTGNTLVYTDGEKTITLNLADDWNTNGWSYQPADRFFYYTGLLNSNSLTPQLLESVELNDKAYTELTANYDFRLDVLADAIQSSDDADSSREWNTP